MMSGEEIFYSTDSVAQEAGADDETSDVNMFPITPSLHPASLLVNYTSNPAAPSSSCETYLPCQG